jgi:hypothetical protein
MKILFRLALVAALAGVVWWGWGKLFPKDEEVIRQRVNRVAALITFDGEEGNFAKVANVEEFANLFDMEVEVVVDTPGYAQQILTGRTDLRQQAFAVRSAISSLEVKFLDLNVTVDPNRTNATVLLTGQAKMPKERDGFVQELKFILRKVEGKWLIYRVETVRTLT